MKKVFAVVLSLVLMLALAPAIALAASGDWTTNDEGSVSVNTVTMGVVRSENVTQPMGINGASMELPPASSYEVTFTYDLYTWDSYNAPTGPGTGYFDSFSVSVAQAMYWTLPLTDPVASDTDIGSLGWIWGGNDYGGGPGTLETNSGTATVVMNGSPTATNYLNVVLDTETPAENNGSYPSWGTITITKIKITGQPSITKELVAASDNNTLGDDILDLGEKWFFQLDITVSNDIDVDVEDVKVKDNFGGDLEVVSVGGVLISTVTPTTLKGKQKEAIYTTPVGNVTILWTGKTEKAHLFWDVGDLAPTDSETLTVVVATDQNPAGKQEYTSEGEHCLNSGATAKGVIDLNGIDAVTSNTTDEICVEVGQPPIDD